MNARNIIWQPKHFAPLVLGFSVTNLIPCWTTSLLTCLRMNPIHDTSIPRFTWYCEFCCFSLLQICLSCVLDLNLLTAWVSFLDTYKEINQNIIWLNQKNKKSFLQAEITAEGWQAKENAKAVNFTAHLQRQWAIRNYNLWKTLLTPLHPLPGLQFLRIRYP